MKRFVDLTARAGVPENSFDFVKAGFERGVVEGEVGDEERLGAGCEEVRVPEGDLFKALVRFELSHGWEAFEKI